MPTIFQSFKEGKGIEWNEDCEKAFQALKDYLGRAPLLSKPETAETLYMYLSVSEAATSSVLVRQEDGIQKPVYYTSKALLPAETRYSPAEKMALALITAARKLRPYFQAHRIRVYTNCPLKLILQKPEVSGRLTKWAIELSEFDVEYLPRTAIKAQAVADFVAEFTEPSIEVARMMVEQNKKNSNGNFALMAHQTRTAAGQISTILGADEVEIFSDSQVVVNQVLDEYQAREESMITYLELARELLERFKEYRIVHVPREENEKADALAKLASATINIWPNNISMIRLLQPSIVKTKEVGAVFGERDSWITPIKEYLVNDILPSDPLEAKRLKYRATRYSVLNGELYKRDTRGHCRDVSGLKKQKGFYWPTLFADSKRVAARCEACQKIANNIRQPPELLQSITSPWPFAMWGIDLIGPMPTATGGAKHAIVAVDYFTKWVEAEPLVHITEANTISFVKKNILYRFGIPNTITDNGTQFDGRKFRELCDKYGINNYYASPAHPQTNGQTEAVNKIIKHNLKAKLATKKGSWADKLPQVLWAYRTTERGSTGETPYSMAYGAEAVIPVETSFSSPRVQLFQPEINVDMLKCGLDELEERRERAQISAAYQQRVARYYNSHVRERRFTLGDLVLKRVNPGTRDKAAGSLADKWEGPYKITGIAGHGAYRITREGFGELPRPCNAQYLKIYYP
ncbi:hypothetical protein LWI29_034321 [Acer saccharum]|uniref:Integrase catalytic domain-containing protein n=1 Tax=Acer saccharum TaxID=4024 RepID=A0AA39VUU9_ACESA|nr:hypothetical protein LWI29_034321 [Acer saccharum]